MVVVFLFLFLFLLLLFVVEAAYSLVPGQHYYVYITTMQSSWLVGNWTLIVPILLLGIFFLEETGVV